MVERGTPLPVCDLVVVPGSKSTIADFKTFREVGWDIDIAAHVRRGGHVLGLCGGYQMLGRSIADPQGIEGPAGSVPGLSLLQVDTVIAGDKALAEIPRGLWCGSATAGPTARSRRTAVLPEPTCMAFSPMTPSAARGSNGSAARRRATATMRTFRARSMRSPTISRRISTSIACSD
jgi:hypothetical protein